MVDMFSIPLAIGLTGSTTRSTGRLVPGGRENIFSAIKSNPDFAPLVIEDTRVIAPGHGIGTGVFPATYFDSVINQVWDRYSSAPMTVNVGSAVRTGRVSGGLFTFDGGVAPFRKPSTADVLYCDGALAAPNDGVTGPVAAVLAAGFNRSVLSSGANQSGTDPATFYRDAVTNHYAKAFHDNTQDGKAYGFAFDDVAGFASCIQDNAPRSMTVELTPF